MESSHKSIRLLLDPLGHVKIRHHIYIPKFVLAIDSCIGTILYQFYITWLARNWVLISSLESQRQLFNLAFIFFDEIQVFVQCWVQTFEIVEVVLFANQFFKEKARKLGLNSDAIINSFPEDTPEKSVDVDVVFK